MLQNKDDGDEDNLEDYELTTSQLCEMLDFLKLPNDMLAPLIEEAKDEVIKVDLERTKKYNFAETMDQLEKCEIIAQFELSEFEKESTFNAQFFLRILHELKMCDLKANNKYSDERSMARDRSSDIGDNEDGAIDNNVEIEEIPEYWLTDVNDMIHPLPRNYTKVL